MTISLPIPTASFPNTPVLWSSPQSLFALSGNTLFYLDADSGQIFSSWIVPGAPVDHHGSIALARNGKFIAATAGNSISLWDASTFARITSNPVIQHPSQIWSVAVSSDANYLASTRGGEITIRRLSSIIPRYYLVDQQPPGGGDDPARVPDGTYRIRSSVSNLYLTAPPSGAGMVVVKPLDQSNASQKWSVSLGVNGAYNITGSTTAPLSVGVRNSLVTGRRGTTWNFDPRGNAYVIGNAANATAIRLAPNRQSVSQMIFNKLGLYN
ncbi:hypothetical protein JVT61DRAFT_6900 [Boletus reticuloceps]|uniref:Uncharacterized protein n=1 Tax=Boletus reticuloceps TaxID=495285 RepID=A0A8I2YLA5_9AGAM|nr:hypothetical protein JVT61DRAFT_6900 [Boletus reticuloceps]